MTDSIRRPERWDHPFDPSREELVRLEWLAKNTPDDESLQETYQKALLGEEEEVNRLLKMPIWGGMQDEKRERLRKILLHDTRVRRFAKGEIIIREGDYGNSAFLILSGSVRVVVSGANLTAAQLGKSSGKTVGLMQSMYRWLTNPGGEVRDASAVSGQSIGDDDGYVPIFLQDIPRILDENRTVLLREGELFGEISILGRTPRTASVFAETEERVDPNSGATMQGVTELLEIRWQGLRDLLKADDGLKDHVYLLYRRNSLKDHLRATPILKHVGDSQAVRESIARRDFPELFQTLLGWESREEPIVVDTRRTVAFEYQLRLTSGPKKGFVLPLDPKIEVTIGRGSQVTLRILNDPHLSRTHTVLKFNGTRWILHNASRYGTIVDRQTVRVEHPLVPGEELKVGLSGIVFELTPEARGGVSQASLDGEVVQVFPLAEAVAIRGSQGVQAFYCKARGQTTIPPAALRAKIQEHVTTRYSPRNIVIFLSADGARQVWRWQLPEGDDPTTRVPKEISFQSNKLPPALFTDLLRPLFLEELGRQTEFQSYGEFTWSQKTLAEHEGGFDWTRRAQQEPIISSEGAYPNGVVLIRSGFARLSQRYNRGDRTLSYLGRGEIYGFKEVAHNWRFRDSPVTTQQTLRALGYCDVLFIPTPAIERLVLPSYPIAELPQRIEPKPVEQAPGDPTTASGMDEALTEFLVERRFVNGTQTMLIDLDRCTRCDDCVRACASTHDNNPRFVRHGPNDGRYMVANACMHCADPVCMIGCPTGAIHRALEGEVVVNDATCIGCSTCANNCPYDNIRMVEIRDKRGNYILDDRNEPIRRSTKCDLCFDRSGGPACVNACPHDALVRLNLNTQTNLTQWLS